MAKLTDFSSCVESLAGGTASATFLSSSASLDGALRLCGSSRLAGLVRGDVVSMGLLTLERGGVVEGNVFSAGLVLMGSVQGRVVSSGTLKLLCCAQVRGDVFAPLVVVEKGARLDGRCVMALDELSARCREFGVEISDSVAPPLQNVLGRGRLV